MEQDERVEQLKEEARRLSGGQMHSFGIDDLPKGLAEEFLERVIAAETAPTTTDCDRLAAEGVPLPPPDEVGDREIGAILWRVIFALAGHRTFLSRTNHLSNRELYSVLWHTVLREEIAVMSEGDTGAWHVDIPGDDAESTNFPEVALPSRDHRSMIATTISRAPKTIRGGCSWSVVNRRWSVVVQKRSLVPQGSL